MKIGRVNKYPWYQELLGVLGFATIIYLTQQYWSLLPESIASKIAPDGVRSNYASKSINLLIIVGLYIFIWACDTRARYMWLAQEVKKRFNWSQFLFVDGLVLIVWGWYILIQNNLYYQGTTNFFVIELIAVIGGCMAYLIATELLRPVSGGSRTVDDSSSIANWDRLPRQIFLQVTECPSSWRFLSLIGAAASLIGSIPMLFVPAPYEWVQYFAILGFAAAALLGVMAFGYRYTFSEQGIEVRLLLGGFRLKQIPRKDILGAEVFEYSALADFGGWGIRGNKSTIAYILGRERGLLIKTPGKNVLLSTENPGGLSELVNERLAKPKE